MQFVERYFLTFLLFWGMAGSLYATEPVPDSDVYMFKVSKGFMYGIVGAILAGAGASFYDWFTVYNLGEIPIPSSLQSKDMIVKQLRSSQQKEGGCGWYMLFNAWALQELVEQGKEITAAAIEKIVGERLIPYVAANQEILATIIDKQSLFTGAFFKSDSPLDELQIIALAEHAHLRDYYVLRIGEHGSSFWNGPRRTVADIELKENWFYRIFNLKEAFTKFKQDKAIVKHIFLGIPSSINESHWVLVTLINCSGEKPMIMYMDSNNVSLQQCWLDYVTPFFVQKIINYLIAA